MAKSPSWYLHFSFLFHLVGVSSLLAGYSSPHWTLVKLSTGEVWAMGLVVSCYSNGCEMLHVTEARTVFVIVFGMCTATVLLSVFVLQVSCLAICNKSCRTKNVGTGLSYFSFLLALSIGATLALYQLDLAEERRPGVVSLAIGWSRYSVIASSLAFLSGALLNIADYVKRNRFNWLHTQGWQTAPHLSKRADVRNKMVELVGKNYPPDLVKQRVRDSERGAQRADGGHLKGERMARAVGAAMKMAAGKNGSEKSPVAESERKRVKPNTNVIFVNEAAPASDGATIKCMGKRPNDSTGSQSQHADGTKSTKRTRLVKTANVGSTEVPTSMPEVEEDPLVKFADNDREQRRCRMKGEIHNSPKAILMKSSQDRDSPTHFEQDSPPHPKSPKKNADVGSSSCKYVVASKKKSASLDHQGLHPSIPTESEKCDLKIAATCGQRGRRGSTVGDAVMAVSRLLEGKRSCEESNDDAASGGGNSVHKYAHSSAAHAEPTSRKPDLPSDNSLEHERDDRLWNQKNKQHDPGDDGVSIEKQSRGARLDTDGLKHSKDSQRSVQFEKENDEMTKSSDDDSANDNGAPVQVEKAMTLEQMKRFQILEAMCRDKKRKRILLEPRVAIATVKKKFKKTRRKSSK